jgi:hypothetical protein
MAQAFKKGKNKWRRAMELPLRKLVKESIYYGALIIITSWLTFACASDSIFNSDTSAGKFLAHRKVILDIPVIEGEGSIIHFSFSNIPNQEIEGSYLRPFDLESEDAFWRFIQKNCEQVRQGPAFGLLYSRKFDLGASLLTFEMTRIIGRVFSSDSQSFEDFENIPEFYKYLGRSFRNDIISLDKEIKSKKALQEEKEIICRMFS